jgi:hypothetical protein
MSADPKAPLDILPSTVGGGLTWNRQIASSTLARAEQRLGPETCTLFQRASATLGHHLLIDKDANYRVAIYNDMAY